MEYTASELMTVAAARELAGAKVCFVGIGRPNLACNLAKRIVAPDLELVYESGIFGARPSRMPLSIGDPCLVTGASAALSMGQLFQYYLQAGLIDVGFLGGAQIDKYGNINTTVIGDYIDPKVRLPGSGGACEIALLAKKVLIIMPLSQRAFVERVDFITSPGYLNGGEARANLGDYGSGPTAVITDKCILRFDQASKEMVLASLHPGVTVEEVQAEVGWRLKIVSELEITPPPSPETLRILRGELAIVES